MKNSKRTVAFSLLACSMFIGCGDYAGGEQASAQRSESTESPNFGSATDVSPADGRSVDTNNLNLVDSGIGGALQRESGNFQSQPAPGQTSDQELAKQIKVALTTGSMGTTGAIAEDQLTKIDVKVRNGLVVLTGPVASDEEKRTIERQIAGMKGVKSVRNMLTVGGRTLQDNIQPLVPRAPGNQ
jgi:hypothetical protein